MKTKKFTWTRGMNLWKRKLRGWLTTQTSPVAQEDAKLQTAEGWKNILANNCCMLLLFPVDVPLDIF